MNISGLIIMFEKKNQSGKWNQIKQKKHLSL
jgi:hypothetical protein